MLETSILNQVRSVFQNLEAQYTFHITCHPRHGNAQELTELLKDVAGCSDKLSCEVTETEEPKLEFSLLKNGKETGVKFRGIPNGHEFTSLLLAILNADGKGKNLPDKAIRRRIQALKGPISLQTYVSLTCTNCPDVVQALNIIALLNRQVTHEMIDGALFQEEVDALKIQGVPSVYANGKLLHVGRGTLGELLQKLEEMFGSEPVGNAEPISRTYDVLVLGGGPAGASAAIYSARKGLRVAIVAEKIGGQVKETVGIENLISVPQTTGAQLADNLRSHINHYPIDLFEDRKIEKAELQGKEKRISVVGGEAFISPSVIIATGASWRKLNVEGETEYIGRGVAFCPHCDGPFYQGKDIAVIGGGNTAMDSVRTARRLGAERAMIIYRRSEEEMPARIEEVKHAKEEGVEFLTLHNPIEYIADELGKVKQVILQKMELGEPDASGRRSPVAIPGATETIDIDLAIVSVGVSPNPIVPSSIPGLEMGRKGTIAVNENMQSSIPTIYAGGDIVRGGATVILAMGDGRKAAAAMHEQLSK